MDDATDDPSATKSAAAVGATTSRTAEGARSALRAAAETLYRDESRFVLAVLVRLLGDFDLAEEALQEAFAALLERDPNEGLPRRPREWLISTGRFKALDALRRRARFDAAAAAVAERLRAQGAHDADPERDVADDRLRLVFMCCHPALTPEARVAMTLREVAGLTTEEIARAFLTSPSTIAQRIVRAKAKIREERIPYEEPSGAALPARLDSVLRVVYLVFNEGWSASTGASPVRADLSGEAIRLGRLIAGLLPDPEATGLFALMLLQDSRRAARTDRNGDLVLLDDQDRSLWNRAQIAEGAALVERALRTGRFGTYALQAAIAAVHAEAPDAASTDWLQIVGLYDLLLRVDGGSVVALNRAVAIAMREGPAVGLAIVESLMSRDELTAYVPAHAARADLLHRCGRFADARSAFERARALTRQEAERRYFDRRLRDLAGGPARDARSPIP
jgi:RNA polymerase sigma-70 factor, ECF subfamily